MFKRISEITTLVKIALSYRELAEFMVVLYETVKLKFISDSGKLSDEEKETMKKKFGEAIDRCF